MWLKNLRNFLVNINGGENLTSFERQRSCWPDVVICAKVTESDPKLRILANVHLISVGTHRFDCHPTNAVRITMHQKIVMQV